MIDSVGPHERERLLRSRQKALEQIRAMSRKPIECGPLNKDTILGCAVRIQAVDGETEAVKTTRAAANAGLAESRELLALANELAKVQSDARRVASIRKKNIQRGRAIRVGWKIDNTPEGILERLSMAAATNGATLIKYSTGGVGVVENGFRIPKSAEVLGYYDIRADARDMLADIKEAMA